MTKEEFIDAMNRITFTENPVLWYNTVSNYMTERVNSTAGIFKENRDKILKDVMSFMKKDTSSHPTDDFVMTESEDIWSEAKRVKNKMFAESLFSILEKCDEIKNGDNIVKDRYGLRDIIGQIYGFYMIEGVSRDDIEADVIGGLIPMYLKECYSTTNNEDKEVDEEIRSTFRQMDTMRLASTLKTEGAAEESSIVTFDEGLTMNSYNDNQMSVFGPGDGYFLNGLSPQMLKEELYRLTSDGLISSYTGVAESEIRFNIPEQMKMYLRSELNASITVVNLKKDTVLMLSIMSYENENFLLYTIGDIPNSVNGISIKSNPETRERKIIRIDSNEQLSFKLIV